LLRICLKQDWSKEEDEIKKFHKFRRLELFEEMTIMKGFMSIMYERCKHSNNSLIMSDDNVAELSIELTNVMAEPQKYKRIYALDIVEKVREEMNDAANHVVQEKLSIKNNVNENAKNEIKAKDTNVDFSGQGNKCVQDVVKYIFPNNNHLIFPAFFIIIVVLLLFILMKLLK